jgi:hypothetical protein
MVIYTNITTKSSSTNLLGFELTLKFFPDASVVTPIERRMYNTNSRAKITPIPVKP